MRQTVPMGKREHRCEGAVRKLRRVTFGYARVSTDTLSESLFRTVEKEQGYAFISDGLDVLPDADVIAIARGSLYHSRRVVRFLEQWIRDHDDGSTRRMLATGSGKARR